MTALASLSSDGLRLVLCFLCENIDDKMDDKTCIFLENDVNADKNEFHQKRGSLYIAWSIISWNVMPSGRLPSSGRGRSRNQGSFTHTAAQAIDPAGPSQSFRICLFCRWTRSPHCLYLFQRTWCPSGAGQATSHCEQWYPAKGDSYAACGRLPAYNPGLGLIEHRWHHRSPGSTRSYLRPGASSRPLVVVP